MSFKGGRGIKAPYESTHVRVPLPIKHKVEELIQDFKMGTDGDEKNSLTSLPDLDEAIEIAKEILVQKKSAKISLQKLLTALYNTDVSI